MTSLPSHVTSCTQVVPYIGRIFNLIIEYQIRIFTELFCIPTTYTKFQIQEAHDVLMSSKERAQYNHQLNQESYYGSKETSKDGPPRWGVVLSLALASSFMSSKFLFKT